MAETEGIIVDGKLSIGNFSVHRLIKNDVLSETAYSLLRTMTSVMLLSNVITKVESELVLRALKQLTRKDENCLFGDKSMVVLACPVSPASIDKRKILVSKIKRQIDNKQPMQADSHQQYIKNKKNKQRRNKTAKD